MTIAADPKTDEILYGMLTENTGRHMLDSGGAYGRNWERAQGKTLEDFMKAPESDYEVDLTPYPFSYDYAAKKRTLKSPVPKDLHACINPTIDLFHFLRKRLDYEPDFQAHLEAFAAREDQQDSSWFGVLEDWLEHLNGKYLDWNDRTIHDEDADGRDLIKVQGPDSKKPQTVNSYNHECHLSQTIQFTLFTLTGDAWSRDGQVYCALMVHGGCDVRGGYTRPKIFSVNTSEWTSILDFDRVSIDGGCSDHGADRADWFCVRWSPDGGADHEGREALLKIPGITPEMLRWDIEKFPVKMVREGKPVPKKRGILYVAEDGKTAYCPFTGSPITVWPWPE